jgi:hypothetical protein
VPATFFGSKRDIAARRAGADAKPLAECSHSRRRAGVPYASQVGSDAGSTFSQRCAGATWRRLLSAWCGDDYRTPRSLPARSGHDLEDGGRSNCTVFADEI